MAINDQELTIEIENLRSSDMENVKQAFRNLKQSSVTQRLKEKLKSIKR
jgi:hypothetical protein